MLRRSVLILLLLWATVQAKIKDTECESTKDALEQGFHDLSSILKQLKQEKRECDEKVKECSKLETENKNCTESKKTLQEEALTYAKSFDELGNKLRNCKLELVNMGSNFENSSRDMKTLQTELAFEKQEKNKTQEKMRIETVTKVRLQEEIKALKENNAKSSEQIREMDNRLKNLQNMLDAEKNALEVVREELDFVKTEYLLLQGNSTSCSELTNKKQREITNLKAENKKLTDAKITEAEKARKELDSLKMENLVLQRNSANCSEMTKEMSKIRREMNSCKAENIDLIDVRFGESEKARIELDSLKTENSLLQRNASNWSEMTKEISINRRKINNLEAENKKLLDAKKREAEIARKELDSLKMEKTQLQKSNDGCNASQNNLRIETNRCKKEIARLEAENRNLLKRLTATNNQKPLEAAQTIAVNHTQGSKLNINRNGADRCKRIGSTDDLTITSTGIYYFNYKTALPWAQAKEFCEARGIELASAETTSEVKELGKIRSLGYYVAVWTSATDKGRPPRQFFWPSGRKVVSHLWSQGQPIESGKDDCGYIFNSNIKASACSASFYFACQVPKECTIFFK